MVVSLKTSVKERDLQLHQNDTSAEVAQLKQTLQERNATLLKLQENLARGEAAIRSLELVRVHFWFSFSGCVLLQPFYYYKQSATNLKKDLELAEKGKQEASIQFEDLKAATQGEQKKSQEYGVSFFDSPMLLHFFR